MRMKSGYFVAVLGAMFAVFLVKMSRPEMPTWDALQLVFLMITAVGVWRKE